jgi:hypothetical protein
MDSIRAEIFFGAAIPFKGNHVSEFEFAAFLRRHCTFQGFTVFNATGHWQDEDPRKWSGVEKTRVMVIYGTDSPAFAAEVRKLAGAYARDFNQDSVAIGFTRASFDFADKGTR